MHLNILELEKLRGNFHSISEIKYSGSALSKHSSLSIFIKEGSILIDSDPNYSLQINHYASYSPNSSLKMEVSIKNNVHPAKTWHLPCVLFELSAVSPISGVCEVSPIH